MILYRIPFELPYLFNVSLIYQLGNGNAERILLRDLIKNNIFSSHWIKLDKAFSSAMRSNQNSMLRVIKPRREEGEIITVCLFMCIS
jgi:hypothetical protein